MLRLTLRTLLAYLDDTLDPAEARDLGTRVAASAPARDLMDRIKKVTRRRGLPKGALAIEISADAATWSTPNPPPVLGALEEISPGVDRVTYLVPPIAGPVFLRLRASVP